MAQQGSQSYLIFVAPGGAGGSGALGVPREAAAAIMGDKGDSCHLRLPESSLRDLQGQP